MGEHILLHAHDVLPPGLFVIAAQRWGLTRDAATALLTGSSPASTGCSDELTRLRDATAGHTVTTLHELSALGPEAAAALDEFLLIHGWRLIDGYDVDASCLAEHPELIVSLATSTAEQLQVSQRTVLRDLDTLCTAGVPVYAARGQLRRVRVRLTPAALQLAIVNGKPEGWRPRHDPTPPPDRPDWIEGSLRFDSYETAIHELLTLGPDVEVLLPAVLRTTMATIGRRILRLHRSSQPPT